MPARTEVLGDGAIGGEETLGMAWRFKPLQVSLSLTCWLMRILRPVVEIPMLPMFYAWENFALSRSVAPQLILSVTITRGT